MSHASSDYFVLPLKADYRRILELSRQNQFRIVFINTSVQSYLQFEIISYTVNTVIDLMVVFIIVCFFPRISPGKYA